MGLGYGVGDFIGIGALAWNVYKSCKDAPGSFGNVAAEVLSLHVVLKEAEEMASEQCLPSTELVNLEVVQGGCRQVLEDLQKLVEKYEGLGSQGRRTWDRMKWGSENVTELRGRLTSNTGLLTAWISLSQVNVARKLNNYLKEFQNGKRQNSLVSAQTSDSLTTNEKQIWRTIRKELEEIGVTVAAFNVNKEFIFAWFTEAVANGAFEEQMCRQPLSTEQDASLDEQESLFEASEPFDKAYEHSEDTNDVCEEQPMPMPEVEVSISLPTAVLPVNHSTLDFSGSKSVPSLDVKRRSQLTVIIAALARPSESLISAMQEENVSQIRGILLDESKVYWLNKDLLSQAMHFTASRGDDAMVKLLLEKGADIDVRVGSATALQSAAENGHVQVVKLLLRLGADVDAGSWTALWRAARNGHGQVVRLLLRKGADINAPYQFISSPLHVASAYGHEQVVRLLIEKGANVNASDKTESTPLHLATQRQHEQVTRLLLENGANVNAVDSWRRTSLHFAVEMGCELMVRLLLENGADVDARHGPRWGSPLEIAAKCADDQIVRLLLEQCTLVTRRAAIVHTMQQHVSP